MQRALYKNVHTTSDSVLLRTAPPSRTGTRGRTGHLSRNLRVNAGSGHFEIELAGKVQDGIPNLLGGQTPHIKPPQQIIIRIRLQSGGLAGGRHLVGAAHHDELVHTL